MKLVAWHLVLTARLDLGCQGFILICLGRCWVADPPKLHSIQVPISKQADVQITTDSGDLCDLQGQGTLNCVTVLPTHEAPAWTYTVSDVC